MKETPFLEARDEIMNQFKSIPFLSAFAGDHLKQIISSSKIRIYQENETIIQEGDSDRWMYIMITGEVAVSKRGGHIINLSGAGELFGELAALGRDGRSASVTSVAPTTCMAINASIFDNSKDSDKAVFYAVIYRLLCETMGARLRVANDEVSKLRLEVDILKANLISQKM